MTDEEKIIRFENDSFYLLTDVTSGEKVFSSYPNFNLKYLSFKFAQTKLNYLIKKRLENY